MLSLETSIQQLVKAELQTCRINDLVSELLELGRTLALRTGTQLIDQLQALEFAAVQAGKAVPACDQLLDAFQRRYHGAKGRGISPRGGGRAGAPRPGVGSQGGSELAVRPLRSQTPLRLMSSEGRKQVVRRKRGDARKRIP